MTNVVEVNAELENAYKKFELGDLPIFLNTEKISIRKLFKILTVSELSNLSTVEAMNFYLYCQFFKNRLLYSPFFQKNLAYIDSKLIELKNRINGWLEKYEKMLKITKSESDVTWLDDNINLLIDGREALNSVPGRCDYYDKKVSAYLARQADNKFLQDIQSECAAEFIQLSNLFSEIGRIIGREWEQD
ncbi:MAG: hypothetical protein K0R14_27 [Burkholderiales bacterium]|nr:hypothetical protein [Burkholderiales bacterium]